MRLLGAAVALLALTMLPAFAASPVPLDQATKNYLEGRWSIVRAKSNPNGCEGPPDLFNDHELLWQNYDIAFRRSSGKVVESNFVTSLGPMDIVRAEKTGRIARLHTSGPGTLRRGMLAVEPLGPNTMRVHQTHLTPNAAAMREKLFAYRCDTR